MINHVRTLLLNKPAAFNAGLVRTAYISDQFKPVPLASELVAIRDALIPPTGSRQNDNDVANIIMRILHSPDLEPYVLNLDKRITYGGQPLSPLALTPSTVTLDLSVAEGCDVVPKYTYVAHSSMIPAAGKYTWSIASYDANSVRVTNTKGMTSIVVLNPTSASTTSLPVHIIPGYLSVYFELPTKAFTGVFKVNYELDVSADYDVAARYETFKSALISKNNIFDTVNAPDIVPVLHDIWLYNPALVTRYGAGVLAYIYALESRRSA